MRRLPLLLLLLACQAAVAAGPPKIVDAAFGLFSAAKGGAIDFAPAQVVPRVTGQRYGWIITLRTHLHSVAVREEYLLPSTAQAGTDAATGVITFPLERRSQVSQRQLVPVGGRIYGEWSVGPGEPAGKRHLQVIVEGELAGDFVFDVR